MTTILQLSEDTLFVGLAYTTPLDFLSLSQTCLHFCDLMINDSNKHPQINKYWQQQCACFWRLIDKNNYKPKNYNYKCLFESMANFVVLTDESVRIYGRKIEEKVDLRIQAYKMKVTLNDIFSKQTEHYKLGMIIKYDNLKMFKIYTCNMNDDDINTHRIESRFGSKSILFTVITSKPPAMQIANYLLAPVEIVSPILINDESNIDDTTDINSNNNNNEKQNPNIETYYNFAKIDVTSPEYTFSEDTPLTMASHYKHVEIVSLLIKHPNMTKNGINKGDQFGTTPLHCASTSATLINIQDVDVQDDAVTIAQMLLNDDRTNANSIDNTGSTPLLYAIRGQPKVGQILIDNEKVDVNIRSRSHIGSTALHVSIETMMKEKDLMKRNAIYQLIKKLLSRKDFDKNIKNGRGETGLDLAKKAKLSQVVKILKLDDNDTCSTET